CNPSRIHSTNLSLCWLHSGCCIVVAALWLLHSGCCIVVAAFVSGSGGGLQTELMRRSVDSPPPKVTECWRRWTNDTLYRPECRQPTFQAAPLDISSDTTPLVARIAPRSGR